MQDGAIQFLKKIPPQQRHIGAGLGAIKAVHMVQHIAAIRPVEPGKKLLLFQLIGQQIDGDQVVSLVPDIVHVILAAQRQKRLRIGGQRGRDVAQKGQKVHRKQAGKAVLGTILVFLPLLCCRYLSGQIEGWQPFSILITEDVLNSSFPLSVLGMAVIILVWGFFEGFNYAVISEKINRRYPPAGLWLDMGAVICAAACLLLHPFNTSFWGIVELITTFTAIYGMLIVKRQTGNAWGCVFAFCFIWNAF